MMRNASTAPASASLEVKKPKHVLVGIRILSIIATVIYATLFNILSYRQLQIGENEKVAYNIEEGDINILIQDEIYGNYYKAFHIINITCGIFLILLNIINVLSSFEVTCFCINLIKYKKYIRLITLHLQILFISIIFMENLENQLFFCNIKDYIYWFNYYNYDKNLFLSSGNKLCIMHNYAYIFTFFFLVLSLIEFFALYIDTDKHFRKKFFLFYIKLFTAYFYLSLFYIYLKNRNFFKRTLSKYNVFNLDNLSDTIKIIIYSTQKQKNYYFQLLLVSTIISAALFSLLSYYDLYSIIKTCKYSLFICILINGGTLIFIIGQVLFSSYLLEGSLFFCAYEDYIKMTETEHEKAVNSVIAPSNSVETKWFCNMNIFLYIYLANNFTSLLAFAADFMLSTYMVFSKKYASKTA
ncbi:conserved Plasmodium protein, unknown function [Plasmodium ovale]|uniref:Uncharacterized protein n=1 Tax=Plasmodium ovale TaxID=36330 RepID=A0A1C3KSV8_PLAOA|nr:conserved Plasmodium protein, unknown function [Plasmodium ovale]